MLRSVCRVLVAPKASSQHVLCSILVLLPGPGTRIATATRAPSFTTSALLNKKANPPRPKPPPEEDIEEFFLKGSGPGGQKINKTNSAVQLRHIPTGIVVKCQATRSRESNRKEARKLLAQRIDEHFNGDQARSVVVGQTKKKRADSAAKKSRRKYKKLAEEANNKEAGAGEEEVEAQAEDGDGQEAEKITEKRQLEVTREEEDMEVETRIEKKNQDPPPKT